MRNRRAAPRQVMPRYEPGFEEAAG
jgi:hypothetical protein